MFYHSEELVLEYTTAGHTLQVSLLSMFAPFWGNVDECTFNIIDSLSQRGVRIDFWCLVEKKKRNV